IEMKQHSVQEAYLKSFEDNGRIWAHEMVTKPPRHIPAKKCTMEVDFQNHDTEHFQNRNIEKPAIEVIRALQKGEPIDNDKAEKLFMWSELHLLRNQKFRSYDEMDYSKNYHYLTEIESKFRRYFCYLSVYRCSDEEYFITSDNPVMDISVNGFLVRIFSLSPDCLVLMSPIPELLKTDINFPEMVNSSLYANRYKYVFSNRRVLPLESYELNATKFRLKGSLTTQRFVG
ncbi:hypothetical protein ACPFTX_003395, partial [Vibrio cholerae]